MKAKKTAPPRRRVSFAVDRDEIEINSDWVEAVMRPVATASPRDPVPVSPVPFPSLAETGDVPAFATPENDPMAAPVPGASPDSSAVFFAPDENNATGAESTTVERCTSVEDISAVDKVAPVVESAAVVNESSVEERATVAESATVETRPTVEKDVRGPFSGQIGPRSVENPATVVQSSPDAAFSTGALFSSTKDHRTPRPRPILRVTDGLTPGQYAVYSLMYEAGEGDGGTSRIYKGGYADLGRLTGLSKRGIQNIVAELQVKQVIRLHQQPGYHRTETSAYLVPDPDSVLRAWFANGWRHALGKSKVLVQ